MGSYGKALQPGQRTPFTPSSNSLPLIHAPSRNGWTRVVVEKPFGRDSASSRELSAGLARHLREDQTYRIDHYLGKELIENLTVLRFSNLVFEPLWSRQYIRSVQVRVGGLRVPDFAGKYAT